MAIGHRAPTTARSHETWQLFAAMSKADLFDVAMHFAALCTDSYDGALADDGGHGAAVRLAYEATALADNGLIPTPKRLVTELGREWRDAQAA